MKQTIIKASVIILSFAISGVWTSAQAQRRYGNNNYDSSSCLTGTYRLNQSRSDDANRIADKAANALETNRDQVRDNLVRRLEAPEELSFDQRGRTITISSSRAPQVTIDADGRTRSEQNAQGRNISVRAWLTRNQLDVSTTGNRGSDYSVTFEPIANCRNLRVTRRLSSDRLSQPVVAYSVYEKTSDVAQTTLNNDNNRETWNNTNRPMERRRGSFVIPDGTQIIAILQDSLTTRNTRDGDRFTMTIRSPGAYEGAILEGFVRNTERSGRVTGRAGISLEFDRIRLRNGSSGDFAATIENVRTADGSDVRVEESGVSENDSQSTRTATRTGVGAALGAIIGAIAGGGKGAAIGAAVGAGAGAGSVIVQGRDDLNLQPGTEFTLRTSAPSYAAR